MTETPRVPDLRWHDDYGLFRYTPRGPMLTPGYEKLGYAGNFRNELPADAVKLVPSSEVDAAVERAECWEEGRAHGRERLASEIREAIGDADRYRCREVLDRVIAIVEETPNA